MTARAPHVLVIDDSAVTRQVLSEALTRQGLQVSVAADALIALRKMEGERPDVIVLDLQLPRMDGLTFLRRVMAEDPIPVVVCSNLARPDAEPTLRALEEGAIDVVAKPTLGVAAFLRDQAAAMADTIRAAAGARLVRRWLAPAAATATPAGAATAATAAPAATTAAMTATPPARPFSAGAPAGTPVHASAAPGAPPVATPPAGPVAQVTTSCRSVPRISVMREASETVIAIGASTGGTEALAILLAGLPADAPAVVVVQHMPAAFTGGFAARLNGLCRIEVREAAAGDQLLRGLALVAPGDRHLTVVRRGRGYVAQLDDAPPVSRHRPSVDVLFRSVARSAGASAIGVVLTGMGDDGAQGLLEMRAAGARTLVQDEETSVVFGMGREAARRGAAEALVPLPRIAGEVMRLVPRRLRDDG